MNNPRTGYLLLAPSLFLFGLFFIAPLLYNVYLSFHSWDMLFPMEWAGLGNYSAMVRSPEFGQVVLNTLLYSGAAMVLSMALGLFLAVALNSRARISTLLQGFIFSSYIVSWVGVSLLWLWLLDPTSGVVNRTLMAVGLTGPDWLGDPDLALWTLVGITVWKSVGYDMIIFLAGLQSIPKSVYEAGDLDGTTPWQRFRHLTWPLLRPSVVFLGITSLIMSFQTFDVVRVMTQGGPASSTSIYIYYVWEQAFVYFDTGYSAAAIVVFFVIILALTLIQFRWLGRRNATGDTI